MQRWIPYNFWGWQGLRGSLHLVRSMKVLLDESMNMLTRMYMDTEQQGDGLSQLLNIDSISSVTLEHCPSVTFVNISLSENKSVKREKGPLSSHLLFLLVLSQKQQPGCSIGFILLLLESLSSRPLTCACMWKN